MTASTLVAQGLSKELGGRPILRAASFRLSGGECLALFGANGSGKTTLMNVLTTLRKPTRGRLLWNDRDVATAPNDYRRQVGFVGHEPLIYPEWSALANLRFFARLYRVADAENRVAQLLDEVGLTAFAETAISAYSRGMVQRLTLARALLHSPSLLFLDEPFTGLDETMRNAVVRRLRQERERGAAVFLVTHDLELGYEVASKIGALSKGVVEMVGRPPFEEFRERYHAIISG